MAEIASNIILESDAVKVWDFILRPGMSSGLHTHIHNYVYYVTTGSTLDVKDANGNLLYTVSIADGTVAQYNLNGDELIKVGGDTTIPSTHEVINVGDSTYHEILVELKQ